MTNELEFKTVRDYIYNLEENKGILNFNIVLEELSKRNNWTTEDIEEFKVWLKCDSMNEYEEGFLKGYDCKKCNNRGYMNTYEKHNGKFYYPIAVDCECKRIRAMYTQLEQCGITNRQAQRYTLENYETKECWQNKVKTIALKYIQAFMNNKKKFDKWFMATGQSGAGKSHICTSIYIEMLKLGLKGKFMLWKVDGDRLLKLKKSFDVNAYDKAIQPYKVAEVLYIDDLFKLLPEDGQDRTHLLDIAFTILDARYSNGLPTIISTENHLRDIEYIDQAIYGRMKEMVNIEEYLAEIAYSVSNDQRRK